MLQTLKNWVRKIPFPLTQNHRYDLQTRKIIRQCLPVNGVAIDIGCHKGEVLDDLIRQAPGGHLLGFKSALPQPRST